RLRRHPSHSVSLSDGGQVTSTRVACPRDVRVYDHIRAEHRNRITSGVSDQRSAISDQLFPDS
ncbi:MAG TPA: hypothetical protein VFL82_17305, partial [Thermomicrobiales bacterium]|nr:hypothetical protein [Thermomicrobiales bacterium]